MTTKDHCGGSPAGTDPQPLPRRKTQCCQPQFLLLPFAACCLLRSDRHSPIGFLRTTLAQFSSSGFGPRVTRVWARPSLTLQATSELLSAMAESQFPIIIDLGDDPTQWPADPYKFFTQTCIAECSDDRCWHGLPHHDGKCEHCKVVARLASNRAIQVPQTAPLRCMCRRCFPVEQAGMNDCPSCPRHSPIDTGLSDKQLLFYETQFPGAEINPAPTSGHGHEQKGREKAYQSWQQAAPLTDGNTTPLPCRAAISLPLGLAPPLATAPGSPLAATTPDPGDLHGEVARLEEQVHTLQRSLDLQRLEIDSLNEQIHHLLEMHKSLAKDLRGSHVAGGPGHSSRTLSGCTHGSSQVQTRSRTRQTPKTAGPPEAAAVDPPPGLTWQPRGTAAAPGTSGFTGQHAPPGLTRQSDTASGTTGVATSPWTRKGRPCIIGPPGSPQESAALGPAQSTASTLELAANPR